MTRQMLETVEGTILRHAPDWVMVYSDTNSPEWIETIEHGWNRLWTSPEWKTPRTEIADYGKGDAAERVLAAIRGWKG